MLRTALAIIVAVTAAAVAAGAASGCQLAAAAASKGPPVVIPAAYDGLGGNAVAVWTWVDPAVDLDYPPLNLHLTSVVVRDLQNARDAGERRSRIALADMNVVVRPESASQYAKDPRFTTMRPVEIAPRLGADRVVYLEVERFTTQGGTAPGLWRGVVDLKVKVYAVTDGAATPAYEESGLRVVFPPTGPQEGSQRLGFEATYAGLVDAAGRTVARRFYPHFAPE